MRLRPQHIIAAVALATSIAGSASAETFKFSADARAAYDTAQVDIAFSVFMPPNCTGRWSIEYPAGFIFSRGALDAGNLRGTPGRGSYDIALKTQDCPLSPDYVLPAKTTWHKVVVY